MRTLATAVAATAAAVLLTAGTGAASLAMMHDTKASTGTGTTILAAYHDMEAAAVDSDRFHDM